MGRKPLEIPLNAVAFCGMTCRFWEKRGKTDGRQSHNPATAVFYRRPSVFPFD